MDKPKQYTLEMLIAKRLWPDIDLDKLRIIRVNSDTLIAPYCDGTGDEDGAVFKKETIDIGRVIFSLGYGPKTNILIIKDVVVDGIDNV